MDRRAALMAIAGTQLVAIPALAADDAETTHVEVSWFGERPNIEVFPLSNPEYKGEIQIAFGNTRDKYRLLRGSKWTEWRIGTKRDGLFSLVKITKHSR